MAAPTPEEMLASLPRELEMVTKLNTLMRNNAPHLADIPTQRLHHCLTHLGAFHKTITTLPPGDYGKELVQAWKETGLLDEVGKALPLLEQLIASREAAVVEASQNDNTTGPNDDDEAPGPAQLLEDMDSVLLGLAGILL